MTSNFEGPRHVLIGQTTRLRQIARMAEKLGRSRWPVLLLGETGTGKEVIARAIHSGNPVGPFVTVDCSSLVGPLMESELFGHVKGAFTGAATSKLGLLEAANGGTAFLDEIGELPLDLQAKLLRVLQEKEFRPVGSLQQRKSDFRIIAATNRDLAKEVEKGTFRRDLFYRLNVVTLRLPALRDRKEDLGVLIAHFLTRHGQNHSMTQETLQAILAYDWPGNVRELENCIQHMVAVNSGPLLQVPDLPSAVQNHLAIQRGTFTVAAAASGGQAISIPTALPPIAPAACEPHSPVRPLAEIERETILGALDYTKGDRAVAAHLLGIGRTTLYRKLKEYDVAD